MAKGTWLVKSEPGVYSFSDLVRDKKTVWDHVRNFQARNNLRAMKEGDLVLYYHSQTDRAVVGVAKVVRAPYDEKTSDKGEWSAVDIAPVRALTHPVTLEQLKTTPALKNMPLIKHTRLSVMPITKAEFDAVVALGS